MLQSRPEEPPPSPLHGIIWPFQSTPLWTGLLFIIIIFFFYDAKDLWVGYFFLLCVIYFFIFHSNVWSHDTALILMLICILKFILKSVSFFISLCHVYFRTLCEVQKYRGNGKKIYILFLFCALTRKQRFVLVLGIINWFQDNLFSLM